MNSMEETQDAKSKSPVIFIVIGVLVIAALGVIAIMNMQKSQQNAASTAAPSESPQNTNTNTQSQSENKKGESSTVKTVNIEGGMYYFSPKEIRVKQGDTVKIHFTSKDGMHDWVLDEFNVKTPVVNAGETADVEFVASKKGTFEYYCSVGDHRAMGMVGNLLVE